MDCGFWGGSSWSFGIIGSITFGGFFGGAMESVVRVGLGWVLGGGGIGFGIGDLCP